RWRTLSRDLGEIRAKGRRTSYSASVGKQKLTDRSWCDRLHIAAARKRLGKKTRLQRLINYFRITKHSRTLLSIGGDFNFTAPTCRTLCRRTEGCGGRRHRGEGGRWQWRAEPVRRIIMVRGRREAQNSASFAAQLGCAVAQSTVARYRYLKHAVNVFFT